MKGLFTRMKTLLLLGALSVPLFAQADRPVRYFPYDPTGPCSTVSPMWNNWTGHLYRCVAGSWQQVDGAASFATLSAGTNAGSLLMGSGGSLSYTGTGFINANRIFGVVLSSLTGVVYFTNGVPSVVAGGAANCVLVNGTSNPCGSGVLTFAPTSASGTAYAGTLAGATYAPNLTILFVPDVLNSGTTPCINISSQGCKTIVRRDGNAVVANQFQPGAGYIVKMNSAQTAFVLVEGNLVGGATSCVTVDYSVSPPTVDINTACVMTQTGTNTPTGANDFSGASKTAPARIGSADPGTCDNATREQFFNTTSNTLKYCGPSANTWTAMGGGATLIKGHGTNSTGTTSEVQLAAISMPAMATDSYCQIKGVWTKSGTAGNWTQKLRLTNTSGTTFAISGASGATSTLVNMDIWIFNTGATTQKITGPYYGWVNDLTAAYYPDQGGGGNGFSSTAANLSSAWILSVDSIAGAAGDTITLSSYNVSCAL